MKLTDNILNNISTGLWALELDPGAAPRLFVEDKILALLGLPGDLSPQELFTRLMKGLNIGSRYSSRTLLDLAVSGKMLDLELRWNHSSGSTVHLRARCGHVQDYRPGIRLEGICADITGALHINLEENDTSDKLESIRTLLESSFPLAEYKDFLHPELIHLYIVNLQEDTFRAMRLPLGMPAEFEPGCDSFSRDFIPRVLKSTVADDRYYLSRVLEPGALRARLSEEKCFAAAGRYVKNSHYSELRFMRSLNFENDSTLLIAFSDRNEHYRMQRSRSKMQAIINDLAADFHTIWTVDSSPEHRMFLYRSNDNSKFKHAVKLGYENRNYNDALRLYTATIVYEDDREQFALDAAFSTIERETAGGRNYATTHRFYSETGTVEYHQLVVARHEDPIAGMGYIFAFRNVDNRARERLRLAEENRKLIVRLENTLSIAEEANRQLAQSSSIIAALGRNYTNIILVNPAENILRVVQKGGLYSDGTPGVVYEEAPCSYNEWWQEYISLYVHPVDRGRMTRLLDIDFVLSRLSRTGETEFSFRIMSDVRDKYNVVRVVVIPGSKDGFSIVMGIANIDAILNERDKLNHLDRLEQENIAMRDILNSLGTGAWSLQFDRAGKLVNCAINDMFTTTTGYSQHEFSSVAADWTALIHPDDTAKLSDEINALIADLTGSSILNTSFRLLTKDRGCRWFRSVAKLQRSRDGAVRSVNGIMLDVDERVKTSLELEHALVRAESANKAKTTFLRAMSHDIRTPINAVLGYTAMARKYTLSPMALEYLAKAEISGHQLLELVNEVLEVSRIEAGITRLNPSATTISRNIFAIQTICSVSAEAKGLKLELEPLEIVHNSVYADSTRIIEIINNILSNAIKYTPEGGRVTIKVTEKPYDRRGFGLYIITISDTGIGMSKDFVGSIFDEFSREDSSRTSGIEGTGLGMPIVKRITELLGGTVDVESEKGRGTTVTLSLPLEWSDDIDTAPIPGISGDNLRGIRVLVAEDNEMNREIVTDLLQDCGMLVTTAEDGLEAYELIKNSAPGSYDVVLMDIQMPHMNGFESAAAIRALENKALSSIPIIALTASAFAEDRQQALDSGMNDHAVKPIDIPKLKNVIAKHLR